MKKYFDLHCHPFGKHFLTHEKLLKKQSPWDGIKGGALNLVSPILSSQSSLEQLTDGNVKVMVCSICPIERAFTEMFLIKDLVGTFTVLNKKFITKVKNGNHFTYNELFNDELKFIELHASVSEKKLNLMSSVEDLSDDNSVLNMIIGIEGSHALQSNTNDVVSELIKLKNYKKLSFLYLTLTHLAWNDVCNHAYGAKMTSNNSFKPNLNTYGISDSGFNLIRTAYSKIDGKRILIDIKHMSAYARKQFYQFRKENNLTDIPILASHIAANGMSFENFNNHVDSVKRVKKINELVAVEYKKIEGICGDGKKRNRTSFNSWTINLFDEEIIGIINSKGLIGLSLDQRILGFKSGGCEYFRSDEYQNLAGLSITDIEQLSLTKQQREIVDLNLLMKLKVSQKKRKHLRYLCNNILHMVKIGGKHTWKHLTIGSDFDGLVNAVSNCKDSTSFNQLENELSKMLMEMMAEDSNYDYGVNSSDIEGLVRGIMYDNGVLFLQKYYSKDYLN